MSLLIGIKTENGKIRYISLSNENNQDFDRIVGTLRNFYKSTEKVNALISLGNLHWLGASPYNKNKGDEDTVNCESLIRDRKLSAGKHGSNFTDSEEEFVKRVDRHERYSLNCCFLFENGEWYILVGSHKENIRNIDKSVLRKSTRMNGLTVYKYDPGHSYQILSEEHFYTWEEVRESADTKNMTYYIFRGERILTIIHPTTPKAA